MTSQQGYYERDRYGAGMGQYSDIQKENWQPITFTSGVLVPAGQALVIAGSWGLVVGLLGGVVCQLTGWPVRYAILAGMAALAVLMAWQTGHAIEWTRGAYLAREHYQKEQQQGAAAEKAVLTIEWVDHEANGGHGQITRENILGIPMADMQIVARVDELSKRALTSAGLGEDMAMDVVSQLLALGYALRDKKNEAATWTSKGNAYRRAFTGGGGGGGVVVDVPHQSVK